MDPTIKIFLGILAGLIIGCWIISYIRYEVNRKQALLNALSGSQHIDMELLANSKVLVAVLNATEKTFSKIPDNDEKNQLYKALQTYTETSTQDNSTYTMMELSRKLSNESFLDGCTHLSNDLKSLCREALKTFNSLSNEDSKTTLNIQLFKRMIAFGLNSVMLTEVHVHA